MPFVYSVRGKHNNPSNVENIAQHNRQFNVTGGDVVYTAGGYVIHMFTSVGDSSLKIQHINQDNGTNLHLTSGVLKGLEYLVIGGGGAGGSRHGGGGGAGGMIVGVTDLAANTYPTSVGAGGAAYSSDSLAPSGQNSTFNGNTAQGGGGGGAWGSGNPSTTGGSGSGASRSNGNVGAAATQPQAPMTHGSVGFGNPGGNCYYIEPQLGGGGGGGAGSAGGPGIAPRGGLGGDGRGNSITGTAYYWAGGGGGGSWRNVGGPGGIGGGGAGIGSSSGSPGQSAINNGGTGTNAPGSGEATGTVAGTAGTNTGSGGGGALQTPSTGGGGGPGIIVVRYPR